MSGFTCQDHAGAGHREGGERRVLEAEPDPALLYRAFPGVDDFGQARSAVDDVAPGSGGGPEVELAEQTLECLIRVGLEDEDRLSRRQQQLVAHQEGVDRVERRALAGQLPRVLERASLQRDDDGCTLRREQAECPRAGGRAPEGRRRASPCW